jgi:exodeoxyribonuclease VII small subunit
VTAKKLSFEEALGEMERIIERLERDEPTLSQALADFEQGVALMRICDSHLQSAEGKLKELTKGENGELIEKILGTTPESLAHEDDADE